MRRGQSFFRLLLLILALGIAGLALHRHLEPVPPVPLPPLTGRVDRIVVEKSARRLALFQGGRPVRGDRIAPGFSPAGAKVRQGDGKTPEGAFRIDRRNGQSRFHLSLGLDYPRPADIVRARADGYDPGGDIMTHGRPNAFFGKAVPKADWTAGCIALADEAIEELWRVTKIGTPVDIRP